MSSNLGHKSPININTNEQLNTPDKGNVQYDGIIADSFVGRLKLLMATIKITFWIQTYEFKKKMNSSNAIVLHLMQTFITEIGKCWAVDNNTNVLECILFHGT